MGLDITAYEKVTFDREYGENYDDNYDYGNGEASLWPWPDGRFADRADGLKRGIYKVSGESHGFRAGSYGGYNEWRRQLAQMVGVTPEELWAGGPDAEKTPFFELINFADNEGVIGPKTSAKLAADFAAHQATADAVPESEDGVWFRERYADWRRAFELAAKGGAVSFH